jgi:hypothetical protein
MEVGRDFNKDTFHEIVVQQQLPHDMHVMRTHFKEAIHRSRMHFLKDRRSMIVKNDHGTLVVCDVQLYDKDTVTIWPRGEPPSGYKIDICRGTIPS